MKVPFMRGRTIAILLSVCAVAMLMLALLYAFAPDLRSNQSNGADALSRSAVGFQGLKNILVLSGISADVSRDPPDSKAIPPSLTILTPEISTKPADLANFQTRGPVLVVLPKWVAMTIPTHQAWVFKQALIFPGQIDRMLVPLDNKLSLIRSVRNVSKLQTSLPQGATVNLPTPLYTAVERVQTLSGGIPLLAAGRAGALLVQAHSWPTARIGPVYILADPDLLNNHGLSDQTTAENAIAIVQALRVGNGPVLFDVTLNGLGQTPSLARTLFVPPLLGATLAALAVALLMALHTAVRFGAPLSATFGLAHGKQALADNSAALVRIMGREGRMALRYVQASRAMVLERLNASRVDEAGQTALILDRERSANPPHSYTQLQSEAQAATNGADLLSVARKTFAWRRTINAGH